MRRRQVSNQCGYAGICYMKGVPVLGEKIKELQAIIYQKYNSESHMAREMGWKKQRLNKILNQTKEPNINEINDIALALDCSAEEIALIFLRRLSPNEQQT